jgi:glutaredoxin
MKITLYTGPNCSLCDNAIALINELNVDVDVEKINIRESVDLYHLYGARIPVIKRHDKPTNTMGEDLGWPFTLAQLRAYLA